MKPNFLRNTILDVLIRIEKDQGFSHLLVDHEIKSSGLSPKDVNLLTEVVYGTMQRKITLDYYISHFVSSKKKLDLWVKMLLRMSIYQMVYLDKVPDHAIIHESVEIAKQRGHKGISGFINGVLRSVQRDGVPNFDNIKDEVKRLSIETSHPEWLVSRWVKEYGVSTTKEMCQANLMKKPQSIRIQPLRITREEAMERLQNQGFEVTASPFSPQGIIVEKGNILSTDLFRDGLVSIQDQSSMLVGEMLDAHPQMVVLDACSAPGGKATHIAEKMENQGVLYAYDLHKKKANLITKKANQLGLSIIQANQSDARKLQEQHEKESFDRILIDAPCSGLGVIRGKPEIKYNKNEEDVKRLSEIQLDILTHVAPLLKRDGLLIYSTCTVDVEENEQVVKEFLSNHPDFQVDPGFFEELPNAVQNASGITTFGLQLFPQSYNTDGFFLTRLRKH
ncbi:16S rRNA (cytosine(967)-C(5))-methyltransferase RsmB [Oceanobacillus piezotolerans]|uniref:16S rRNA (cytosine(967)-C(5))-methyltransferase n=1 Tax=Oceanobacillus piezotolerans TaxID=2448030 RepID=A0A498DEU5_9BACI|nr:16S rRNA (cytosine(967)-C(5))-methyltransferase RsmB [Oceanobacillus piezotolerans]RLL45524.1 16S rRNA (cytosine(967)-C(5))-methyltransferase RsmB [Oceanobacillus piezotolerans]